MKPMAADKILQCRASILFLAIISFYSSTAYAGNGTLLMLPTPDSSSARVVSLWGGGGSEQIVLKSDGTVWDWGFNNDGQLGNGTTNNTDVPVQVLGPHGAG